MRQGAMARNPKWCRRSEAGTTAIEFAAIAPLLLLLLGGICETGAFLLIQSELQLATDKAARQIRTNKVGPTTAPMPTVVRGPNQMSLDQFKTLVCGKLSVPNCAANIRVNVRQDNLDDNGATSFAELMPNVPNPLESVGPAAAGASYTEIYQPSAPGEAGSLVVTYDWKFVFPGLSAMLGNSYPGIRRLSAISVYRNEL